MEKRYTESLARAQKKYGQRLRQFKFALSKQSDANLISLLERIPNIKSWIINQLKKENTLKIKVVKVPGGRRLIKGKYADILDIDYTQSMENIQKDIDLAMPSLLENLSVFDNIVINGDILVYRGGNHIDIVLDGNSSLGWLKVEHYFDEE